VELIIAAPDAGTRALLQAQLSAVHWPGGAGAGWVTAPAELRAQLPVSVEGPARALIVTAGGLASSDEFVRVALARGAPVLIWPMRDAGAGDGDRGAGGGGGGESAAVRLTARERQVLSLVAAGESNKRIARLLKVSPNTVKFHLSSLFARLGVTTRAEAIAAAARRGELSL
jgi:DNA-binding CsgD family transcriptional regulator